MPTLKDASARSVGAKVDAPNDNDDKVHRDDDGGGDVRHDDDGDGEGSTFALSLVCCRVF